MEQKISLKEEVLKHKKIIIGIVGASGFKFGQLQAKLLQLGLGNKVELQQFNELNSKDYWFTANDLYLDEMLNSKNTFLKTFIPKKLKPYLERYARRNSMKSKW